MHNKLQAKLLLNTTLENLESHQLSPTPDNYRLWFEYGAGGIEQLNSDIDNMISQQQAINQTICKQLFLQHIANKDQVDIDETRAAIGDMLTVVVKHLQDWDSSSTHFCESLNDCLTQLGRDPSLEEVKKIVTTVTDQAKNIQGANLSIKTTLHALSNEISGLRQDVHRLGSEATTDALTQTMNRRGFDINLKETIETSAREGFECALIVVDVDDFKRINDDFGHTIGDKILKYIATTFRKHIRGGDMLARYGGEEFVIILPQTNHEGALKVAETLKEAISARQLTTGSNGKVIGRITISAGVASYIPNESGAAFFERADRYMYMAKNKGKNQVIGPPN